MIYKYWCNGTAGIKTDSYDRRFSTIAKWTAIAKHDVPGLKDEDISIVSYQGDRWKYQTGIEFPAKECPEGYEQVHRLEPAIA